jgi:hypothetical protein
MEHDPTSTGTGRRGFLYALRAVAFKYDRMSYIDLLHDCYKDELWGSRVFELFRDRRRMAAREQAVLGVLVTLEKAMQGHLSFVLRRHGQAWDQRDYALQADTIAQEIAAKHGDLPWHRFNAEFEAGIGPYLQKYQLLRSKAPEQDHAVMDLFVAHEKALKTLARAEQVMEHESSLSTVWRVLETSQALARATGQRA